jgi:alpha-galactosidase
MFAVIGWPGQWSAEFARDAADGLAVRGGLELTHYRLHAGEETRGPLILLMFYKGDLAESQNLWRRFYIAHNSPRHADGVLPQPQVCGCTSHVFNEMVNGTEENQTAYLRKYLERRIPIDVWHMDAGWYPNDNNWSRTGTWEIDAERFPRGFRPVTDLARSKGMTNIVWFECERVTMYTWLMNERPQWLISVKPTDRTRVLNLGNPEALDWLINHVDAFLTREGVETYRQDFNHNPLDAWRANDTEDRQGITEIKHLMGYLKFWDTLVERHPGMVIDGNASGGKRDDLESMRRSINLTRSDYLMEPEGLQNQSLGLPQWLPYSGTGLIAGRSVLPLHSCPPGIFFPLDAYTFRSMMAPSMTSCFDVMDDELDYAFIRRMLDEYRRIARFYYADFYPLTPPSDNSSVWIAWQFHDPDAGEGVVQVFRREESPYRSADLKLRGLTSKGRYRFRFSNSRTGDVIMTGAEAMRKGLPVTFRKCPDSAVVFYEALE